MLLLSGHPLLRGNLLLVGDLPDASWRLDRGSLIGRHDRVGFGGVLDSFSVSVVTFPAPGGITVHAGGTIVAVIGFTAATTTPVGSAGSQRTNTADDPYRDAKDSGPDLADPVERGPDTRNAFRNAGETAVRRHDNVSAERAAPSHRATGIARGSTDRTAIFRTRCRADTFIVADADRLA